jgi:hypothetical protein
MKEDEMYGACNTRGREEKLTEGDCLEDPDVDGRII